jgi:hypothetical protein
MLLESVKTHEISVVLSERFHAALLVEAQENGVTAREMACIAFESGLRHLRQKRLDVAMAAYAVEVGGTLEDYDPAIEATGLEVWEKYPNGEDVGS